MNSDTLRRMVAAAEAAGHTMRFEHRPAPVIKHKGRELPGFDKYWLVCSCGYESTAKRSHSALMSTLVWHAGKAAGEASGSAERVNGGVSVRSGPRPGL